MNRLINDIQNRIVSNGGESSGLSVEREIGRYLIASVQTDTPVELPALYKHFDLEAPVM